MLSSNRSVAVAAIAVEPMGRLGLGGDRPLSGISVNF